MRSALAIALLLSACAAEPRDPTDCFPLTGVEKVDLYGTWSHRAIVIASETPSVAVGDETASEVEVTLEEDFVVAYGDGHEPWLAFRAYHFDVVERTLPSGERVDVASTERPWWQREASRIDIWEELIGASVPTEVELEPMSYAPEHGTHDVTYYPERDDEDRVVWSFVSAYWVGGSPPGEILVRHELERIEP